MEKIWSLSMNRNEWQNNYILTLHISNIVTGSIISTKYSILYYSERGTICKGGKIVSTLMYTFKICFFLIKSASFSHE